MVSTGALRVLLLMIETIYMTLDTLHCHSFKAFGIEGHAGLLSCTVRASFGSLDKTVAPHHQAPTKVIALPWSRKSGDQQVADCYC